jgi:hypothetical protein
VITRVWFARLFWLYALFCHQKWRNVSTSGCPVNGELLCRFWTALPRIIYMSPHTRRALLPSRADGCRVVRKLHFLSSLDRRNRSSGSPHSALRNPRRARGGLVRLALFPRYFLAISCHLLRRRCRICNIRRVKTGGSAVCGNRRLNYVPFCFSGPYRYSLRSIAPPYRSGKKYPARCRPSIVQTALGSAAVRPQG